MGAPPLTLADSRPRSRFRADEVVHESLGMLRRGALPLLALIAALYWLPVTAIDYVAAYGFGATAYPHWYMVARTSVGLVLIEFLLVGAAAIVLPEAGPQLNAPARAAAVLSRRALPIVALGLLMNVTGFLGTLLVTETGYRTGDTPSLWIIPSALAGLAINLAIQSAIGVAGPVVAAEPGGLKRVLARAARLLAGQRLVFTGFWAAVTASRGLVSQFVTLLVIRPLPMTSPIRMSNIVLFVVGAGLVIWGVVSAAFYRELVRMNDEGLHGAVAEVFD